MTTDITQLVELFLDYVKNKTPCNLIYSANNQIWLSVKKGVRYESIAKIKAGGSYVSEDTQG